MSQSEPTTDQCTPMKPGLYGTAMSRAALLSALAAAQSAAARMPRLAANEPAALIEALRPVVEQNGLTLVQLAGEDGLVTIVGHGDGATLVSVSAMTAHASLADARAHALPGLFMLPEPSAVSAGTVTPATATAATLATAPQPAEPNTTIKPATPPAMAAPSERQSTRIVNADSDEVRQALTRVKSMSARDLDAATAFAPSKYAGQALEVLRKAFNDRAQALSTV